jgi:hypothetical protein
MAAYVTLSEAQTYFDGRLHETAWSQASGTDRSKSLDAATQIIDALNFKGYKHSVWLAFEADPDLWESTKEGDAVALQTVRDAEASQELQFPRGADTVIIQPVKLSTYEIAYSLLDGVNPDLELENLMVNNHGIGSVRASFNRQQEAVEHVINGIPSATAWRFLKPLLRDDDHFRLYRVS